MNDLLSNINSSALNKGRTNLFLSFKKLSEEGSELFANFTP